MVCHTAQKHTSYIYYKSNKYRREDKWCYETDNSTETDAASDLCVSKKSMRTYAADRSVLHYGSHLESQYFITFHAVTPHIFFSTLGSFCLEKRPSVYVERNWPMQRLTSRH